MRMSHCIIVTEILRPNSILACAGLHDVSSSLQRGRQKLPACELDSAACRAAYDFGVMEQGSQASDHV
jgi:hypothetical protein